MLHFRPLWHRPEARSSPAAERVEDQEALEGGAVVGDTADFVNDTVNELLANRVMSTSIYRRQSLAVPFGASCDVTTYSY